MKVFGVAAGMADLTKRTTVAGLGSLVACSAFAGSAFSTNWSVIAASLLLACTLIALSAIDLATYRLPDALTFPLIGAGLIIASLLGQSIAMHAVAAIAGYLLLRLTGEVYAAVRGGEGLGQGDMKLFAASGAWVGVEGLASVLLWSTLSALAVLCAAWLLGARVGSGTRLPFGPFIAAGTWMVWVLGPI